MATHRNVQAPNDVCALIFEACVDYEMTLRSDYAKKVSFIHILLAQRRNDDVKEEQKKLDVIEDKLEKLHRAKYLFGWQHTEDRMEIPEFNTHSLPRVDSSLAGRVPLEDIEDIDE